MTYGADFRPGTRVLPRHDNVTLPPVAEYEAWIESRPARGQRRIDFHSGARLRRICYLYMTGNSIAEAARLSNVNYAGLLVTLRKMPRALVGERLFLQMHGGEAA